MTDTNFDNSLVADKKGGLFDLLAMVPVLGWFIKAFRFGGESDVVLSILSFLAILGAVVFFFGYPAFLAIILTATVTSLVTLVYMTLAMRA
jgi:hypothetical protein